MNVPYEFDEARREEYQLRLQGAPSRPLEYRLSGLNMDINFGAPESHPSAGGLIVLARGNGKHLLPGEIQTARDVVVEDGACWHETDFQNWVKGFTQQTEITFEVAPLPVEFQIAVIRAGWEAQYGITAAEVMERIAERKADNEMIHMLDAMVQVGQEAGAAWAAWQAAVKIAAAKIAEAAAAFCNLRDAVVAAFNETWPRAVSTLEEIQVMMDKYGDTDVDEPEEPDRHDGAVEVMVTWLLPVPSLYELYGQGVDHGGPGPSRLTLTRVTDDGLRRAETGLIRKGENTMIIFLNILLGLIAFVLFLGTVGEKDGTRQKNITLAFVATLAAIVLINFVA